MRVRHERPMSDLSYSVRAPLKLTLESGDEICIKSWSLNGVQYPEKTDILPKAGLLSIPFQGVDIQFDVRFKDGSHRRELLFDGLSGRQRETLAIFYRSILSGKMASTEEVITSLDTPVDLVPMTETNEEEIEGRAKQSPRILRVIWNVSLYLVLAVIVFGVIGSQVINRLAHVELLQARIVAPMTVLHTSQSGFVDQILVEPGQSVEQGQTLVHLNNPETAAALDDVRANIARYERLIFEAEQRLAEHRKQIEASREHLKEALRLVVAIVGHENFAATTGTLSAQEAWNEIKRFDENRAAGIGRQFEMERHLTHEVEDLRTYWSRLKRDLGNAKNVNDAVDIVAPTDGVIVSVDVFENQFLDRGVRVIEIEENTPRLVKAWLSETRSDMIFEGMKATVRFNAGLEAKSSVGEIVNVTAAIDPDISKDFGLIVTVHLNDLSTEEMRQMFRPNAPVQMRAKKRWLSFLPWIAD
ncbi:Multidrug resistance efflux pump [Cognatiyoonia sediminum]|uniref:Multidrug resistance efflux pump n=2 Tax=Cognatiyoonia sediminum TaxID=1508389 RepID=A0A1M5SSK1_9RHOB|nr:Multidrug resistance efflux pump [Cognatiyoonia sediminum]